MISELTASCMSGQSNGSHNIERPLNILLSKFKNVTNILVDLNDWEFSSSSSSYLVTRQDSLGVIVNALI